LLTWTALFAAEGAAAAPLPSSEPAAGSAVVGAPASALGAAASLAAGALAAASLEGGRPKAPPGANAPPAM
jgi:hypothetical protein